MIVNVFIGFVLIYFLLTIFFTIGFLKLPFSFPVINDLPSISILVSCRNEEKDLPDCIESLSLLDYPKDKLQIILIDDYSTDATAKILAEAARNHDCIESYVAGDFPDTHLEAKARGIARAASKATGEWLFITDADGRVPSTWLKHMLSGTDAATGMIVGFTEIISHDMLSVFEKVASFFILPIAFGMAGWGIPLLGLGPNMAIRKSFYDNAGGLENVTFNVAEDLALFNIVKKNKGKIKYHADVDTLVKLTPVPSFRHINSQQRRWMKGGSEGEPKDWILFVLLFSFGFSLSMLFFYTWIVEPQTAFILTIIEYAGAFIILLGLKYRIKKKGILRLTPIAHLCRIFSFAWLPISFLFDRNIAWMGEGYKVDYK